MWGGGGWGGQLGWPYVWPLHATALPPGLDPAFNRTTVAFFAGASQALAGAALASGGSLAGAKGDSAAASVEQGGRHKKHKKPWLNRKIEGMFRPFTGAPKGRKLALAVACSGRNGSVPCAAV